MEIRQLKTFQTVAKLLNFHRAADALNYSQSAISAQIKSLEEELGVSVFDRLGKSIRLTEAGQMLMQYSRKILDLEKEVLSNISGWKEPNSTLTIRIPQSVGTYILPAVLSGFQKKYPRVGLDISTCAYHSLQNELKTGLIDVAFLLADSIPFADLKSKSLGRTELVFVAFPGHRLVAGSALSICDLSGETIILPKHDCSYRMKLEQTLIENKVAPATIIELNCVEAVKRSVENQVGIALLPLMSVASELKQNQIAALSWEQKLETGIIMIRHKDKWISPTLSAFMKLFQETLAVSNTP